MTAFGTPSEHWDVLEASLSGIRRLASTPAALHGLPVLTYCRAELLRAARCTLRQLLHHEVQAEAAGLLARRELLEGGEELADDVLSRDADEGVVEPPVVVRIRRDVCPLERIGSQVEQLREP